MFTDPTIMHNIASHFIDDEIADEFALPGTDLVPFEDQVQGEFTRHAATPGRLRSAADFMDINTTANKAGYRPAYGPRPVPI